MRLTHTRVRNRSWKIMKGDGFGEERWTRGMAMWVQDCLNLRFLKF